MVWQEVDFFRYYIQRSTSHYANPSLLLFPKASKKSSNQQESPSLSVIIKLFIVTLFPMCLNIIDCQAAKGDIKNQTWCQIIRLHLHQFVICVLLHCQPMHNLMHMKICGFICHDINDDTALFPSCVTLYLVIGQAFSHAGVLSYLQIFYVKLDRLRIYFCC